MRILLLGKSGQLGRAFVALNAPCIEQLWSFTHRELDICETDRIGQQLKHYQPDVLINCTAFTDVPAAENHPDQAYEVNGHAVERLCEICHQFDTRLVHYSTDYVFDGKKGEPYEETDPTQPLNEYGRSKLLGEDAIQTFSSNWLIFRSSWVYGKGPQNFIHKLQSWAASNDRLRIVDDEISIPTAATDIAEFTLRALEKELSGLYHLTASGEVSRYEYALELKRNLQTIDCEIQPAKSAEFKSHVERPLYSVLNNQKLSRDLNLSLPHWRDSLQRELRTFGSGQAG